MVCFRYLFSVPRFYAVDCRLPATQILYILDFIKTCGYELIGDRKIGSQKIIFDVLENGMTEKLRKSGIDIVGDIRWGTHFCQFYQTKEDLMDILVPYFKAGLENNELCIWITSQPLEVEETKEALKKDVPDIDAYLEKGQIEIIPHKEDMVNSEESVRDSEGVFDSERVLSTWVEKLNRALEGGYDGLRLSENIFWPEKKDWKDFIDYEVKLDLAVRSSRMISLCNYPLNRLDATMMIDAVANHKFTLVNREGNWELIESSRSKKPEEADIQATKNRADEVLCLSGQRIRPKLENILSPARGLANMELSEIVDAPAIQSLMDDFYKLAHIPMSLGDLKGNFLVGVGWQDICIRFHRVHPEACKYCIESDTKLSAGVAPGEFRLYRCKNNMWDIATPLIVGGQHVGNVFSGQFFFDDEPLDYELFRSQARKYGFNEKEYIAALEKVPHLSREAVNTGMTFFMKLAHMFSQLSYSNFKLAQSLSERDALVDALRKSEGRFRTLAENSPDLIARYDGQNRYLYVNPAAEETYGYPQEKIIGKSHGELGADPKIVKFWEEHHQNVFATGKPETMEFQYKSPQGKEYYFNTRIVPEFVDGEVISVLAISRDITDIKEAEAKLKETLDNLEELIEERTGQLEQAYHSLKESKERLAEAQKMAHIGNWDWDLVTGEAYWSDELFRILGRNPQESRKTYDIYLSYVHPDDRKHVDNAVKRSLKGNPYDIDYRIISSEGVKRTVHAHGEVIFDEKNTPIRMKGTIQDITERKMAEEAMEKMEKFRIKEIHHRIKNNLQVISSLLSLETERFRDTKILEAFRESQNRITSMALIHEELYKGEATDTLDFAAYLRKLTADLFRSYKLGAEEVKLKLDLEQVYLGIDTAIPLGIIVNELISNALKHAFPAGHGGEIHISLRKTETFAKNHDIPGPGLSCMDKNGFHYVLTVADNGKGIPEGIKFKNVDSLGLQLVGILVEQIDGCIDLKRGQGTKFTIWFNNIKDLRG